MQQIPRLYLQISVPLDDVIEPRTGDLYQAGYVFSAEQVFAEPSSATVTLTPWETELVTDRGDTTTLANTSGWFYSAVEPQFHNNSRLSSLLVILGVLTTLTFVGNVLVIVAIATQPMLRKMVVNRAIASLAVDGMLVALFVMPLSMLSEVSKTWFLGDALCDAFVFLDVSFCTASIFHLLAIAIDRYLAATRMTYFTVRERAINIMIAVAWFTAAFLSVLPLLGWRDPTQAASRTGHCLISGDPWFAVFGTTIAFYAPTALIIAIYAQVYISVRRRIKQRLGAQAKSFSTATSLGKAAIDDRNELPMPTTPMSDDEEKLPLSKGKLQVRYGAVGEVEQVDDGSSSSGKNGKKQVKSEPTSSLYRRPPGLSIPIVSTSADPDDGLSDTATVYDNVPLSQYPASSSRQKTYQAYDNSGFSQTSSATVPAFKGRKPIGVDKAGHSNKKVTVTVPTSTASMKTNKVECLTVPSKEERGRKSSLDDMKRRLIRRKKKKPHVSVAIALMAVAVDHCDIASPNIPALSPFHSPARMEERFSTAAFASFVDIQKKQAADDRGSGRGRSRSTAPVPPSKSKASIKTNKLSSASFNLKSNKPAVASAFGDRQMLWKQREHKTAAILLIVTSAFIICWLPYFVVELGTPLCNGGPVCSRYLPPHPAVHTTVTWLGYCNSLINPIIYTVTSADFRTAFKTLLKIK